MIAAKFRIVGGLFLAVGIVAQAHAESEFQYSIPPGWRDVRAAVSAAPGNKNIANIPQKVVNDAGSGRFAAFAIDPDGTTSERPGAMFNAVETATSGRIGEPMINKYGSELVAKFRGAGLAASLTEATLVEMNGVNVGTVTFNTDDGNDPRTMVQYIIPGRKTSAVLTYSALRSDFSKYRPVFEASARGTKGGYQAGSWNWPRTIFVAAFCAVVGGIFGWLRHRREGGADDSMSVANLAVAAGAPAKPAAAPKKTSKYTWECPGCGKPVPIRLEQCRCGTAKPA